MLHLLFHLTKHNLYRKLHLGPKLHNFRLNNPHPDYELYASEMVVYDEE